MFPDPADSAWDPWASVPARYNLGVALTRHQVERGLGEKPAIYWENASGGTARLTYAQLDALSHRFAWSLARLGIVRGERVFLRLPNIPEFYVAALAVAKLGGIFIPSSTQFRESEVRYRLNDSEAVAAITTTGLADAIERVRTDCPTVGHLIVVSTPGMPAGGDQLDFARLVEEGSEAFIPADTASTEPAFIGYTSGTTGDPKGVVHRHSYPVAYESLVRFWYDYRDDDIAACPSEMGWLLPLASTFLYALAHGLTVVLYDAEGGRFQPARWFGLIEKYRVTQFIAAPTVYRMLMADAPAAARCHLPSWRHAVSAGEPLPADTWEAIRRCFGLSVLDGIGMTECMVYCHNRVGLPVRAGSCGQPSPGTHIELLGEDFRPVEVGQDGVLCLRRDSHPGLMEGYWRKPAQTAEVFRGPWYYSGDVLRRDNDGYFWFQGRVDDVIKPSGYRVSPFEVESCLLAHPAVLEAAAVASPDEARGTVIKAFIVLRQGFEPLPSLVGEIQAHARKTMAPYKCPRHVEFVAALPKTTSGKIRRKELREQEPGSSAGQP